ncbi:unnamed protein product, partial [Ectocarpus fasciculatus]
LIRWALNLCSRSTLVLLWVHHEYGLVGYIVRTLFSVVDITLSTRS